MKVKLVEPYLKFMHANLVLHRFRFSEELTEAISHETNDKLISVAKELFSIRL